MWRNSRRRLPNRACFRQSRFERAENKLKLCADWRRTLLGGKMGQPLARIGRRSTLASDVETGRVASRSLGCAINGLTALQNALVNGLAADFHRVVELTHRCEGRIIVTGMGKSG